MPFPLGSYKPFLIALLLVLVAVAPPAVAQTAKQPGKLSDQDRQRYTSALTLMETGYHDRGLALARQGSHPLAGKIVTWLDLGRADSNHSFVELNTFLRDNPGWPGLYAIYRNAEEVLPASLTAEQSRP